MTHYGVIWQPMAQASKEQNIPQTPIAL